MARYGAYNDVFAQGLGQIAQVLDQNRQQEELMRLLGGLKRTQSTTYEPLGTEEGNPTRQDMTVQTPVPTFDPSNLDTLARIAQLNPQMLALLGSIDKANQPEFQTVGEGQAFGTVLRGQFTPQGIVPPTTKSMKPDLPEGFAQLTDPQEKANLWNATYGSNLPASAFANVQERPYIPFIGLNAGGQAIGWDARTGRPTDPIDLPGGPPVGNKFVPLPKDAQESFTFGFQTLNHLDVMEKALGEVGRVKGWGTKASVWLGAGSKEATDFDTAYKNYRLSVQAMIKGIPSNFDVQIATDVIPDMTISAKEARSRLEYQKKLTKHVIKSVIAYYRGTNYILPDLVKEQARRNGIDINSIEPWDGQGDPILNAEMPRPDSPSAPAPGGQRPGASSIPTDDDINKMTPEELQRYLEGK